MKKNPYDDKQEYVSAYHKDKQVEHYRNIFTYSSDRMIHELEIFFTKKAINNWANKDKCLDIACGFGRITRYIEKMFKNTFGVDTSEKMMNYAKKDCKKTKFSVADAEHLPFDNNTFDCETTFRFIMNFQKPVRMRMLKEFNRVLKKEGIAVINIHRNKYGFRGIYQILRNALLNEKGPYLSYHEAKKEIKSAGFKIIKSYSIKMIPYWRGRVLLPYKPLLTIEKVLGRIPLLPYITDGIIIIARKR